MGLLRRFMVFAGISGYDAITTSYINRMPTKPATIQIQNIDIFIKEVKDLLVAKYDQFFLFGAHGTDLNGGLINIINNGLNCTIGAAGLTYDGYWGLNNPSTGYLDTNFNPSVNGSKYTQNDAGFDVYLSNNLENANGYPFGVLATNYAAFKVNADTFGVNQSALLSRANIPFMAGLHSFNRTASNAINSQNQNLTNTTGTNASTLRPNGNIHLFQANGVTSSAFVGGICAYGVRSKLTDAEQIRMNLAINAFQIRSIYNKYGATNWGVIMAKSYFETLHNYEKYEAFEVYEFIKRMQPDYVDSAGTGYYYNTFGPDGQNKTVCDFLWVLKAGGNTGSNAWTKTGDTLRWNRDGVIVSSNTNSAYTRGTNLGIITLSTTDGWNGVSTILLNQTSNSNNSYYGVFPKLNLLKTAGALVLDIYSNRCKFNLNYLPKSLISSIRGLVVSYPGYIIDNLDGWVGCNVSSTALYITRLTDAGDIYGNADLITNQFSPSQIIINGASGFRIDSFIGTLSNMVISNNTTILSITYSGITGGTSTWNKNIGTSDFSNNRWLTTAVDVQLALENTYYGSNMPIKNFTQTFAGDTMGIPTGGASNTDLLNIVALHVSATPTRTCTITVRTS